MKVNATGTHRFGGWVLSLMCMCTEGMGKKQGELDVHVQLQGCDLVGMQQFNTGQLHITAPLSASLKRTETMMGEKKLMG